jgi:hypothetical protein
MEMKKSLAAIAAVYLLMLSGQLQQVVAMPDFCECYKHCYPVCRQDLHWRPWACYLFCVELECRPIPPGVAAGGSATCEMACGLDNLCGLAAPLPGITIDLAMFMFLPLLIVMKNAEIYFSCRTCRGLCERLQREKEVISSYLKDPFCLKKQDDRETACRSWDHVMFNRCDCTSNQ